MDTNAVAQLPSTGWKDIPIMSGNLSISLGETKIEHGKRYLLTVNPDGSPNVSEIPREASIASMGRYLEMLNEPGGTWVDTETLQRFIDAATERLAFRAKRMS